MILRPFIHLLIAVLIAIPLTVSTAELDEQDFDGADPFVDDAISNCVIEPNDVVELSSRVDGILEKIHAERGDWVEAGGVVAELEAGVERAAVNHAEARAAITSEILSNQASLKYGEITLKRVKELGQKRVVSEDEMDRVASEAEIAAHKLQQSRDNKRLAELELARAQEVLKRHTIVSPIDGVIAERYLSAGESVEEKPIYRIAQIDPLRVELVLPASQYGLVHDDDSAKVHIQGITGGQFDAKVIIVDPVIDAASGTFRVTLELPNPDKKLTSGLRCDVTFVDNHDAVAASIDDKDAEPDENGVELPIP